VPKPIKTTGKLHFTDLSFERFEDLCMGMIYRLGNEKWISINHYGRKGGEQGVDIHAVEKQEKGKPPNWYIQCKRYKDISKSEMLEIIEKVISENRTLPDVLLLIVACDLSRVKFNYFIENAIKRGIKTPLIWTASTIESKLYSDFPDLLSIYFGISTKQKRITRSAIVKRNIRMKEKMRRELLANRFSREEIQKHPWKKFKFLEIIIHSIDDKAYPNIDENHKGISPWFKAEVYDFYHNGLEVTIGLDYIIMDTDGYWDVIKHNEEYDEQKYARHKAYYNGLIPFENIIDYDLSGDEYYREPQFYCDFKFNGMPYEGFNYVLIGETMKYHLDNAMRKRFRK
jgi:hypothetical protein